MQVVKRRSVLHPVRLGRWAAVCLLGGAALLAPAPPAQAYVPPLDELFEKLVAGAPAAGSAILDLRCRVYPYPPAADAVPGTPPTPDPARSFRQRVYWQRGRFLAVETLADDGTLLHVLLDEAGFTQTAQVSPTRRFTVPDVRPLIYPFLEGRAAAWTGELGYWGVQPGQVDLVLSKAGQMYRLAEDPDRALWLARESGRPAKLATVIAGGGAPWNLTIEFDDFVSFAARGPEKDNPRIPRSFRYALNGTPFKDVQVTDYEVDPPARKFPFTRLRQLVAAAPGQAAGRPQ